jgi:2-keto-4-pentenoate hydratase/2-oxohepta-3-ene-1,7-dioic acid hydratase in catechol pathway
MTRYVRFTLDSAAPATLPDSSGLAKYGILDGNTIYETRSLGSADRGAAYPMYDVRWLPPCSPSKIVCVGRNYVEHAKELGNPVPAEPIIFMKPPSSLAACGDPIVYPQLSRLVSYEGELAVVVGKRGRHVKPEDAEQLIFGYTCLNDVTARDLQKKDSQWTRGKGFDTFCPLGPWIVPKEEIDTGIRIRTLVNGEIKQDAPVTDMIFPVNVIIAFVTQFMTLEPGDVLATGTPPGVGPLEVGSEIHIDISGIGTLKNSVIRGDVG